MAGAGAGGRSRGTPLIAPTNGCGAVAIGATAGADVSGCPSTRIQLCEATKIGTIGRGSGFLGISNGAPKSGASNSRSYYLAYHRRGYASRAGVLAPRTALNTPRLRPAPPRPKRRAPHLWSYQFHHGSSTSRSGSACGRRARRLSSRLSSGWHRNRCSSTSNFLY